MAETSEPGRATTSASPGEAVVQPKRRHLLQAAGSMLLAAPVIWLAACRSRDDGKSGTGAIASGTVDHRWASGGTAGMGDSARFPDPFAAGIPGDACALTCMTTIGPCHAESPERRDISDGLDGLPLRLALRVVDADCRPVPGAIVEIWHTDRAGGYSGRAAAMCTKSADDLDKRFFRGYQHTDTDGRATFDTCYPGWYRGRAVHVHLRVISGAYDGSDRAATSVTTQLLFTDALNREIFGTHPLYAPYGQPDTSLDRDGVVGAEPDKAPFLFDIRRIDDGVMFASKTLVVRASPDTQVCEARGIAPPGRPGGPGGPGGPPPEGLGPPPDGMPPPPGDAGGAAGASRTALRDPPAGKGA